MIVEARRYLALICLTHKKNDRKTTLSAKYLIRQAHLINEGEEKNVIGLTLRRLKLNGIINVLALIIIAINFIYKTLVFIMMIIYILKLYNSNH